MNDKLGDNNIRLDNIPLHKRKQTDRRSQKCVLNIVQNVAVS